MVESPGASSFSESMECQVRMKVQCLRDLFQVLSSQHYQTLFVVDHKERVIIRTRIGVQENCNGSNGAE